MPSNAQQYQGSCHCGRVRFEMVSDLKSVARCNCSICRRKGTPMVMTQPDSFKLIAGEEFLSLYQFNTEIARHYFCKVCGIYTHHNPRSNPAMTRVNAGCLDDIDPFSLDVELIDGAALSVESP